MEKNEKKRIRMGNVIFMWDGKKWRDLYLRIEEEEKVRKVKVGEIVC